jgi:hypothetical protein
MVSRGSLLAMVDVGFGDASIDEKEFGAHVSRDYTYRVIHVLSLFSV